jgi:1,4-alpha-glucan branching enzyme
MIHKVCSPKLGHVRIVFELPSCIWADRIFVTGDFNGWDKSATPLRQDRDGAWRATLDLRAGTRHEFRYLIDGQWSTDYHADGCTANVHGSQNSIVIVELPAVGTNAEQPHRTSEKSPAFIVRSGGALHAVVAHSRRDAAA